MKKLIKKLIATFLVVCIATPIFTPVVYAYLNEENTIRGANPFIEYLFDKSDGRFIIRTVDGIPAKEIDNNKKLLFERENNPETSFTTFKIDGRDYIFGTSTFNRAGTINNSYTADNGILTTSTQKIDGIKITQFLEIIEDPEHANVGNVRIRYEATNDSRTSKTLGGRIMLDTQLGNNDAVSFVLGNRTITTETEFVGDEIPDFYRTSDNNFAPNVIAYGFLDGWGQSPPDKVVFAHYEKLSTNLWDVEIDESFDFTKSSKEKSELISLDDFLSDDNLGADSACAYYYNEMALAPGETRIIETFYGIGNFSHYNSDSPFGLTLNVPSQINVNSNKTDYTGKITVSAIIDNSLEGSKDLTGVTVTLVKRDSAFSDVSGESYTKEIPHISKGDVKTISFQIDPIAQETYISEPIKIIVNSNNQQESIEASEYILMPNINGEPPELTIDVVSPKKVYYEGFKDITIKGKGYNMLFDESKWDLYLVNKSDEEIFVPHNNVQIVSDENIAITLMDDSLKDDYGNIVSTPTGEYTFRIKYEGMNEINTPSSKSVIFTSDTSYKGKSYGVLYVEKKPYNDSYKYEIKTTDSVESLNEIKENKTVVFDIVGDIRESEVDGNQEYKVLTNKNDALINSVIKVKDTDGPMEIKKSSDIITIKGDGTLQVDGLSDFWWWDFFCYIADGEDYIIDEVVPDGSFDGTEKEDPLFEIHPEWKPEEEGDFEGKSNVMISFFNPINALSAVANTFYDGFKINIRDVVLLDEGASFGGYTDIEVPFGAPVPKEPVQVDQETEEEHMTEAISLLFMDEDAKKDRINKIRRQENGNQIAQKALKVNGLLASDEGISTKIKELTMKSDMTPAQKAQIIMTAVLKVPRLILTMRQIYSLTTENSNETYSKSTRVIIDVKKVILGKKYNDKFFSKAVEYKGIHASGFVKVSLPTPAVPSQGVEAYISIDTLDETYTVNTNIEIGNAEASANIVLVRIDGDLLLDSLELYGSYYPGVPIVKPLSIMGVGGGVKNLQDKGDDEPFTIMLVANLKIDPKFQGVFKGEFSEKGFSLLGYLNFDGKFDIFEKAYFALQWEHPLFVAIGAEVELFDMISGGANLYIGEVPQKGGGYKFYFEGLIYAKLKIPSKVPIVGGKTLAGVELGISTEKMWGSLETIGIELGVTYVYGKSVKFRVADNGDVILANLTDTYISDSAFATEEIYDEETGTEGTLMIGSNIIHLGSSKDLFATNGLEEVLVVGSIDNTSLDFNLIRDAVTLIGVEYQSTSENRPNFIFTDPNGTEIPLIFDDEDNVENANAVHQIIIDEESGETKKMIYISVLEPVNGIYTLSSSAELVVGDLYLVNPLPKMNSLSMTRNENTLNIFMSTENTEDALISLFLVDEENEGISIANNLSADTTNISIEVPETINPGTYKLRATIQHPSYGFDSLESSETITIVDTYAPQPVTDIVISNAGNGQLLAEFNHDSTNAVDYYISVFKENGEEVVGFTNMITKEKQVLFGKSYVATVGVDEEGNPIDQLCTLPAGQNYYLEITPVLTRQDGEIEVMHVGETIRSNIFSKLLPNPPMLNISYFTPFVFDDDKVLFNTNEIDISYSANQNVETTIYLDEEFLGYYEDKDFNLKVFTDDGEHLLEFVSQNVYGDEAKERIIFYTDTTAPELFIDYPSTSAVSDENGNINIKGKVDGGAKLFINGTEKILTSDNFDFTHTIDTSKIKELLEIKAVDNAGNETIYTSEIINGTFSDVTHIEMSVDSTSALTGSTKVLNVNAIDSDNNRVLLDNDDVEFSIIQGDTLSSVNSNGEITFYDSGETSVLASFYVTEDYMFTDAISFEVDSGIDSIIILPEINSMSISDEIELSIIGQSKLSEVNIDTSNVAFEIESGSEYAILNENKLIATDVGIVVVKATYTDDGNTFISRRTIEVMESATITPQPVPNDGDKDYTIIPSIVYVEAQNIIDYDKVLESMLLNLLEKEQNLEVTSVRKINNIYNNKVTMKGVYELTIPKGTTSTEDIMIVGIYKNKENFVEDKEYELITDIYEFTFKEANSELKNKIELELNINSNKIDNVKNAGVYVYNPIFKRWQYLGGEIVGNKISVSIEHLSKYAVLVNNDDKSFIDIDSSWAKKYINSLKSLEVVNGIESGGFYYYSPSKEASRIEFFIIAVRVYEAIYGDTYVETDISDIFADYEEIPTWAKIYAKKAYYYNIVTGSLNGENIYFYPNEKISRAQTVTVLSRAIGDISSNNYSFVDSSDIPNYAKVHFDNLKDKRLIDGYSDGTVKPNNYISRAEIAKLVYYWIDHEVIKNTSK